MLLEWNFESSFGMRSFFWFTTMQRFFALTLVAIMVGLCIDARAESAPRQVRFATFNVSLARNEAGQLVEELSTPDNERAQRIAAIIQHVRADVLLINEFDYDAQHSAVALFKKNYLDHGWHGQKPIQYPHTYLGPTNTGVPSGRDLNNDDELDVPADAFGFGRFAGQFGMVVLSKHPIARRRVRTFRKFLWKDMPKAALPSNSISGEPYYSQDQLEVLRLSSKNHWDVPITISRQTIHFLVSHPTPPVFDGLEDRNGRRNHDEIRFWADYIDPARSGYICDDAGQQGGLASGSHFVIAGDLNADPHDGNSYHNAARQLTAHPLIDQSIVPISRGAAAAVRQQGRANLNHEGAAAQDTGDFPDDEPGNLRVDYVLPSRTLNPVAAGVFWPLPDDDLYGLIDVSDHRIVWIDVRWQVDDQRKPRW